MVGCSSFRFNLARAETRFHAPFLPIMELLQVVFTCSIDAQSISTPVMNGRRVCDHDIEEFPMECDMGRMSRGGSNLTPK